MPVLNLFAPPVTFGELDIPSRQWLPGSQLATEAETKGMRRYGVRYRNFSKVGYLPALQPPSMMKSLPVMKEASSLARYSAAAAISSGRPIRPNAWVEAISA